MSSNFVESWDRGAPFFDETWNIFDFTIVMLTDLFLLMGVFVQDMKAVGPWTMVVRALRVTRILRLVRSTKGLRMLFSTLFAVLPALVNVVGSCVEESNTVSDNKWCHRRKLGVIF